MDLYHAGSSRRHSELVTRVWADMDLAALSLTAGAGAGCGVIVMM